MSQSVIKSFLDQLNNLVLQGQLLQAFDRFYHDDVVMQENNLKINRNY